MVKKQDFKNMSKGDRDKKMKELKLELVKSKVSGSKAGTAKVKQIKKMIARILTLNNSKSEKLGKK